MDRMHCALFEINVGLWGARMECCELSDIWLGAKDKNTYHKERGGVGRLVKSTLPEKSLLAFP